MFEVLTPLSKIHRVSRKVDQTTFEAIPGIWGVLGNNEAVTNVVTDTPALGSIMILGNASLNKYESNDVEVGRITTLESAGVRCKGDSDVVVLTGIAVGSTLVVSTEDGSEGKLAATSQVADGTYEVAAIVESVDATAGIVNFITVCPYTITVVNPTTTTTAAPTTTTTTAAPTTTTTTAAP